MIKPVISILLIVNLFSGGALCDSHTNKQIMEPEVLLRKAGDDGVKRYRIPGIDITKKGSLIAVYDVRRRKGSDLPGDIDVGMSRSTDGGKSWEPMKIIMDMGDDPKWKYDGIGDPCITVDRKTGTIWVAAVWSHGNRAWHGTGPGMKPEETGQYMLVKSDDDGKSWSQPINITQQIKQPDWCYVLPSPGRGLTMSDGTIVIPSQYQDSLANKRVPHSTIIYSKDEGKTWTIGNSAKTNTTECRVIELADGSLMLNMRDNRGGSRAVSISKDMGKTWSKHPTSRQALVEPVCNAGLIRIKAKDNITNKNLLLFINPNKNNRRSHMTIKVSFDEGMTWPKKHWLLVDEGASAGYASLVQIDKETIGALYEGSRANICFRRIKIKEIIAE
jgi:sialidase-1